MLRTRLGAARLDELVSRSAVVRDEDLEALVEQSNATELFYAVIAHQGEAGDHYDDSFVLPAPRRRAAHMAMAAAAVAVLLAGVLTSVFAFHPKATPPRAGALTVALKTTSGAIFEADLPARAVVGGLIDWAQVPPYVEVVADDRIVGVVLRSELVDPSAIGASGATGPTTFACGAGGVAVYGESLTNLVGHLFPNAGYVPLGQTPVCDGSGSSSSPLSTIAPPPNCIALVPLGPNGRITQCGSNGGGFTKGS